MGGAEVPPISAISLRPKVFSAKGGKGYPGGYYPPNPHFFGKKNQVFFVVQDSSISDIVTHSLSN